MNLKARILIPLAAAAVLVLGAFIAGLIREEGRLINESFLDSVRALERYYATALVTRGDRLAAMAALMAADDALRRALRARDRAALLALSQPQLHRLGDDRHRAHLAWHDVRRVNLLRVHQPDRYGDRVDRATLLAAERDRDVARGIEIVPSGTVALRAVAPVRDADGLLGYVEIGEDIGVLVDEMADAFRMDVVAVAEKKYLERAEWFAAARLLDGAHAWDFLSDEVVVAGDTAIPPAALNAILTRPAALEYADDERDYRAASLTLRDVDDRAIGRLLVMHDVTARLGRNYITIAAVGAGTLASGAFLFVFLYWLMRGTLRENAAHLHASEERVGRILENSWNEIYLFDAATLRCVQASHGAHRNLGYTAQELETLTLPVLYPDMNEQQIEALLAPLRNGEETHATFESRHRRRDGTLYDVESRLHYAATEKPPAFMMIVQDISERRRYIAALERKALYDGLTGLPNRGLLLDRLQLAMKAAHRASLPLAVFIIDVVRLKEVNDILGHDSGDRVLVEVAERLQRTLRESDTICRLGGDEFCVVLTGLDASRAPATAARIRAIFEQPFMVDGTALDIEAAIGVAIFPDHGDDPAKLLQHADVAMRVAKNEADGFSIYRPEDDPFSLRRLRLHGELRQAISEQQLQLYYQPKVEIHSRRVVGVEALARWPHPQEGMIPPGDFVPMIEQSGLIRPFTRWVLEQAIAQCCAWAETGMRLTVAVNLSTRNLLDPGLPDNIAQLLDGYGVASEWLVLEVTESAVMSRPEAALRVLMRLNDMGLKLSIDDFGTGYSSLAYLKKLPVNELKIDKSFVSGITKNDNDTAIVRSTIDLAQNMGLKVVAEGVENENVLDVLAALRCDVAQGYYFSRPLPAEDFGRWLATSSWRA